MDNWTIDGKLAEHSRQYGNGMDKMTRPPADPLGLDGFPRTRSGLEYMAGRLCGILRNLGGKSIGGKQLAMAIFQRDNTRMLRHLVAYCRVYHHVHEIVGIPGSGYLWADATTVKGQRALQHAVNAAMRMGRCFFYIAALHKREGTAMAAVQLVFNFMEHNVPVSGRHSDDLAAMVAAEGVGVAEFLDAFVGSLAKSDRDERHWLPSVANTQSCLCRLK